MRQSEIKKKSLGQARAFGRRAGRPVKAPGTPSPRAARHLRRARAQDRLDLVRLAPEDALELVGGEAVTTLAAPSARRASPSPIVPPSRAGQPTRTTSPRAKRPSTALTPRGRSDFLDRMAARAPSSTAMLPWGLEFLIHLWRFLSPCAASKRVPTLSPARMRDMTPSTRPSAMTTLQPASRAMATALSLVAMPPVENSVPAPPAEARISGESSPRRLSAGRPSRLADRRRRGRRCPIG